MRLYGAVSVPDVASVEAGFLVHAKFSSSATLFITLAPQSVVAALRRDPLAYCPLHSVMQGMSTPMAEVSPALGSLTIAGHDLPLPVDPLSTGCAWTGCAAMGGCRSVVSTVTLSTEPAMLQRDVMRWLRDVGLNGGSGSLTFQPPPLGLWSPALNRSDWVPTDLFCDINIASYTLPALPYADEASGLRMPFPPPAGLLHCLSDDSNLFSMDWRAARFFSSDMLVNVSITRAVTMWFNLDALYGGVRPVPLGFFDPLERLPSFGVWGECASSCVNIASRCPYIVGGVCQPCPLGWFSRTIQEQFAYCSLCPVGHYCDSAISSDRIPCPLGTYHSLTGQSALSSCQICPAGKFAEAGWTSCADCATGRFAPSAATGSCQQCAAGRYQNATSQTACQLCNAGQCARCLSSLCLSATPDRWLLVQHVSDASINALYRLCCVV